MRMAASALAFLIFFATTPIGIAQAVDGERLYEESRAAMKRGDESDALNALRASAQAGYTRAQAVLGHTLYVQRSFKEAFKWTRIAAEKGDLKAQTMLGNMYARGYGIRQDDEKAVEWTLRAAESGDPVAQIGMAARYADGQGVPKDYVQTHKWLIIAWERLPASNEVVAGTAIRIMEGTINKMTKNERAQAKALASEWKPR